jgi:hypothetical protein
VPLIDVENVNVEDANVFATVVIDEAYDISVFFVVKVVIFVAFVVLCVCISLEIVEIYCNFCSVLFGTINAFAFRFNAPSNLKVFVNWFVVPVNTLLDASVTALILFICVWILPVAVFNRETFCKSAFDKVIVPNDSNKLPSSLILLLKF